MKLNENPGWRKQGWKTSVGTAVDMSWEESNTGYL